MLVFSLHQCGNLGTKLFFISGRTFLSIVRVDGQKNNKITNFFSEVVGLCLVWIPYYLLKTFRQKWKKWLEGKSDGLAHSACVLLYVYLAILYHATIF